ncbi:retinal homeobox protein Rax-like [Maniola jurtina]|uniref:retinal homeobox protein Rax-like n=1 Tax=Maniola jurtina TaxID=191418 RepID=UPI001E68FBC1|nr:retinal homeobox protein Rax-like [Maniola jurtina]XP_045767223.1 retinal homeobox protein Rax-like [Maniola jurtina]XP_045767224.1 retinal homeobox protein Rax-like [Maniola jurtina]
MMRYLLLKQLKSGKDSEISPQASQIKDTQDVIVKSKYFHNCATKKSRRFRSAFTTEQVDYLEREFRKFPYIGSGTRREVAIKLNIPERAVKIWFQNRRMKEKKESLNKEFDIEHLSKDAIKFTNEPLNNWQSSHDHRPFIHSFEQAKRRDIVNFSDKPIAQANTANKGKVCSSNKPPSIDNKVVRTIDISKSTFAATKNSSSVDAVPITKKVKGKSIGAPEAVSKQKKANIAPSRNQNQGPASSLPSTKNQVKVNIDQDSPQDLSSKTSINKLYPQQPPHYPVDSMSGSGFVPLHMQSSYPSAALPPGNVFWKPVNMLSAIPVPHSSAVSIGIPQNGAGVHLVNNHHMNSCNCNCHGSLVQCFNQINARPHPQYIVAIPFINPPK